jgi:hypothetical protein
MIDWILKFVLPGRTQTQSRPLQKQARFYIIICNVGGTVPTQIIVVMAGNPPFQHFKTCVNIIKYSNM